MYESITLNVDSTFQWTSEYDLVFSEYGKYELQGRNLLLKFYLSSSPKTMSLVDTLKLSSKPLKTEYYLAEDNKLFKATRNWQKITYVKDNSIKRTGVWFNRFRHKLTFIKE